MPTAEPALVRSLGVGAESRRLVVVGARGQGRQLRQAEVQHLGVAGARDEDVGRLDVAVHDPLGVRGRQRLGNSRAEAQHSIDLHRAPGDGMLQRLPLEQLHHQERCALVPPDLEDHADVRVVERRRRPRLAHEALDDVLVLRHLLRQELERHVAPQLQVLGLVHDTHAAAAEF